MSNVISQCACTICLLHVERVCIGIVYKIKQKYADITRMHKFVHSPLDGTLKEKKQGPDYHHMNINIFGTG